MKRWWNRLRQFVAQHRTGVIVSSIVAVFAVSGGAYAAWSVSSWQRYEETAAAQRQETANNVRTALDMSTDTAEARTTRFDALNEVAQSKQSSLACDMHAAIAWQRVFGSLDEKVKRCEVEREATTKLQQQVETTVAYLRSERELAQLLDATIRRQSAESDAARTVAESGFAAERDAWRDTFTSVETLTSTDAFSETKTKTEAQVKAVRDAWQSLVEAHEKKDRKGFEAARGLLADAYQKLSEVSEQSEAEHVEIMKALENALSTHEPNA